MQYLFVGSATALFSCSVNATSISIVPCCPASILTSHADKHKVVSLDWTQENAHVCCTGDTGGPDGRHHSSPGQQEPWHQSRDCFLPQPLLRSLHTGHAAQEAAEGFLLRSPEGWATVFMPAVSALCCCPVASFVEFLCVCVRENYDFMYVISVDAGVCVRMLMRRVCLQCVCVCAHHCACVHM